MERDVPTSGAGEGDNKAAEKKKFIKQWKKRLQGPRTTGGGGDRYLHHENQKGEKTTSGGKKTSDEKRSKIE